MGHDAGWQGWGLVVRAVAFILVASHDTVRLSADFAHDIIADRPHSQQSLVIYLRNGLRLGRVNPPAHTTPPDEAVSPTVTPWTTAQTAFICYTPTKVLSAPSTLLGKTERSHPPRAVWLVKEMEKIELSFCGQLKTPQRSWRVVELTPKRSWWRSSSTGGVVLDGRTSYTANSQRLMWVSSVFASSC
jgi:hypothetical protein